MTKLIREWLPAALALALIVAWTARLKGWI